MENLYINVFRDDKGILHYSSEEFSIYQERISSFEAAAEDACRFGILGNWHFICTLSCNTAVTTRMHALLTQCDEARYALEKSGKNLEHYSANELLNTAQELRIP